MYSNARRSPPPLSLFVALLLVTLQLIHNSGSVSSYGGPQFFAPNTHHAHTHTQTGVHTAAATLMSPHSPAPATVISQCPQDSDGLSLTRGKGRVTFLVISVLQPPRRILHKITARDWEFNSHGGDYADRAFNLFRQRFALGWHAGCRGGISLGTLVPHLLCLDFNSLGRLQQLLSTVYKTIRSPLERSKADELRKRGGAHTVEFYRYYVPEFFYFFFSPRCIDVQSGQLY